MKKRGESAVLVVVVLVVLIVLVVAVVLTGVVFWKNKSRVIDVTGIVDVVTSEGFTSYASTDDTRGNLTIHIEQKGGENIERIKVIIYTKGGDNLVDFIENSELPGPDGKRIYSFEWVYPYEPEYVSLVPIFLEDGSEIEGKATEKMRILFRNNNVVDNPSRFSDCIDSSDCSLGEVCSSGNCIQINLPECIYNSDCSAGKNCVNGNCVQANLQGPECIYNSDCTAGEICVSGNCIIPPCVSDSNCSVGEVCRNGVCSVLCSTSSDCNDGKNCTSDVCSAGICSNPVNCSAGKICGTLSGNCVDCNNASNCGASGNPCKSYNCSISNICVLNNLTDGTPCSGGSCQLGVCLPSGGGPPLCNGTTSYVTPPGISTCSSSWPFDPFNPEYGQCFNTNDVDSGTEWISGSMSDPQNVVLDLGSTKCINGVQVWVGSAYYGQVAKVEVSGNKVSWSEVNSSWTIPTNTWASSIFSETQGRYVRLNFISSSGYTSISGATAGVRNINKFCLVDSDCNDNGACTLDRCVGGYCSYSDLAENTACSDGGGTRCNSYGGCVSCNLDSHCNDGKECTSDFCSSSGSCYFTPKTLGTSCNSGTDVCDGNGNCVDCNSAGDCGASGNPCKYYSCSVSNTCVLNNKGDGTSCSGGTCQSGVCTPSGSGSCSGTASYVTPPNVVCTSYFNSAYPCSKTNDGDTTINNGWFSATDAPLPQNVTFNLGSVKCISKIRVNVWGYSLIPESARVKVSNDSVSWTTVSSGWTFSVGDSWEELTFSEMPGQYVRLEFYSTAHGWASVREGQISARAYS